MLHCIVINSCGQSTTMRKRHGSETKEDILSMSFNSHWRYSELLALRNSYHCRKWTRRPEFKTWTRLFAFPVVLMPLGKSMNQSHLVSAVYILNSMADWALYSWRGNWSKRKTWNSDRLYLVIKLSLCRILPVTEE